MIHEEIVVGGPTENVVALGIGEAMLTERIERAAFSYSSAKAPPLPRARPFTIGKATLQPIFDRVLGKNHLSKGHYYAGTVSAFHTHNSDQYIIVTAGEGSVSTADETHALHPGMVVWIPRGVPHRHTAAHDTDLEFIFIAASGHSSEPVD
ncbi:MAG: cupin domain-containing protein [Chloroflexi bacterium]|nr:cupin domain-containing protein [Chloroflexota bacterium]